MRMRYEIRRDANGKPTCYHTGGTWNARAVVLAHGRTASEAWVNFWQGDDHKESIVEVVQPAVIEKPRYKVRTPHIMEITVEEWINEDLFPRYKANREETKRMDKKHLKGKLLCDDQAIVKATCLNGVLCKIDGHSRAEAWRRDQLEKPDKVIVMVYEVSSEEEIHFLYKSFNNKAAAESPAEEMYHLKRLNDFDPKSGLVQSSWKTAFNMVKTKGEDLDSVFQRMVPILRRVDSWGIKQKTSIEFGTGIRAAILSTMSSDMQNASLFWELYRRSGETGNRHVDKLKQAVEERRGDSSIAWVGQSFEKAVNAFENWKDSQEDF